MKQFSLKLAVGFWVLNLATIAQSRSVYLNGTDITSAKSQELKRVDIKIDENGNIFIAAPHYQVHEQDSFLPLSKLAKPPSKGPEHKAPLLLGKPLLEDKDVDDATDKADEAKKELEEKAAKEKEEKEEKEADEEESKDQAAETKDQPIPREKTAMNDVPPTKRGEITQPASTFLGSPTGKASTADQKPLKQSNDKSGSKTEE